MKRSVLDYLENTAKRCPERLAWDLGIVHVRAVVGRGAADCIVAELPMRTEYAGCSADEPAQRRMCEGILRRVGGGVLLCAA